MSSKNNSGSNNYGTWSGSNSVPKFPGDSGGVNIKYESKGFCNDSGSFCVKGTGEVSGGNGGVDGGKVGFSIYF